jgi:acyl-homoserine lactone acylase PvdQ
MPIIQYTDSSSTRQLVHTYIQGSNRYIFNRHIYLEIAVVANVIVGVLNYMNWGAG